MNHKMESGILVGDCREIIPRMLDGRFDVCVTSPPYNLNLRVNARGDGYTSRQIVKEISTKYTGYSDNLAMGEYESLLSFLIPELARVSKIAFLNIQLATGNKPALFRSLGKNADKVKEVIVWDKGHGQPAIQTGVMNSCWEFIFVISNNSITRQFESSFRGNVDNIIRLSNQDRVEGHGATMPVSLVRYLLETFTPDAKHVFDPFAGTGSTGIGAFYAGATEFIGCEIVPEYAEVAKRRIYKETRQQELF